MPTADCSELAEVLAQIALDLAEQPGFTNIDLITKEMQRNLPIQRKDVVDAIVAFTGQERTNQVSELKAQLISVKNEARQDTSVRLRIEDLERQIENDVFKQPLPRQRKHISESLAKLRKERDALQREASLRSHVQDLISIYENLNRETAAMMKAGNKAGPKILNERITELMSERERVKRQIRMRVEDLRPQTFWEKAQEPFHLMRAIMTSGELSAVGRQGGFILKGNPTLAEGALRDMARAFTEKGHFAVDNEIRTRQNFQLGENAGLELTEIGGAITRQEEAFRGRLKDKIPGVNKLLGVSEQTYVTFLNKLRADSFDAFVETLGGPTGVTQAEARVIANFVNVATGRGKLPGSFQGAANAANALFFSARWWTSRIQILTGQPLLTGVLQGEKAGRARRLVARQYAQYAIGHAAYLGFFMLLGAIGFIDEPELELDPRSTDFMKLKFGDTRIDLNEGLSQHIVLAARTLTGEVKSTRAGKVSRIRGADLGYTDRSWFDVFSQYLRFKTSPQLGFYINTFEGRDGIGDRWDFVSWEGGKNVAKTTLIPMTWEDMVTVMKDRGLKEGAIFSTMAFFGAGISSYTTNHAPTVRELIAPELDFRDRKDDETPEDFQARQEEREADRLRAIMALHAAGITKDQAKEMIGEQYKNKSFRFDNGNLTPYGKALFKLELLEE